MTPLVAMMAAVFGLSPAVVGVAQGQEAPITISFVTPHYPTLAADQARALADDVNAERTKRGLPALTRDATLDRFAYAKAVEMAARGDFGHTHADGITFQDRLRAWHCPTTYAAGTTAFDRREPHAHTGFMNSPGHASNVLDRNERRID